MKYIPLLLFLLITSCESGKKTIKKKETILEVPTKIIKKIEVETPIIEVQKTKEEILLILKDPKKIEETKTLLSDNGFTFKELLFDKNTLKIALVEIPIETQDVSIQKLRNSNVFSLIEINNTETLEKNIKQFNNTLIQFSKTPCSGDCPTFQITIDKQGNVNYNGIESVLVKGKVEFQLTEKQLQKLQNKLSKTTFDTYNDIYDTEMVDLPNTFVTYNDTEVLIKIWKDVPDELIFVTEYLEDLLLAKNL